VTPSSSAGTRKAAQTRCTHTSSLPSPSSVCPTAQALRDRHSDSKQSRAEHSSGTERANGHRTKQKDATSTDNNATPTMGIYCSIGLGVPRVFSRGAVQKRVGRGAAWGREALHTQERTDGRMDGGMEETCSRATPPIGVRYGRRSRPRATAGHVRDQSPHARVRRRATVRACPKATACARAAETRRTTASGCARGMGCHTLASARGAMVFACEPCPRAQLAQLARAAVAVRSFRSHGHTAPGKGGSVRLLFSPPVVCACCLVACALPPPTPLPCQSTPCPSIRPSAPSVLTRRNGAGARQDNHREEDTHTVGEEEETTRAPLSALRALPSWGHTRRVGLAVTSPRFCDCGTRTRELIAVPHLLL
jgi:hypothetical protein